MAISLDRAIIQIQRYIDSLHRYNRLPQCSLKRFEDRRGRRSLARTVLEGRSPRLAGYEFSAVRFRSVSGDAVETCSGLIAGSGPLVRCAPSWAAASRGVALSLGRSVALARQVGIDNISGFIATKAGLRPLDRSTALLQAESEIAEPIACSES